MLKQAFKNLSKFLGLLTILTVASILFGSHKAEAATLNVVAGTDAIVNNGQCQLSEAIVNLNDQAQTYPDCLAGDSNNDTINLPAGTITLSGDLPSFGSGYDLTITGLGKSNTFIDANSFVGFYSSSAASYTLQDFSIIGAASQAIYISQASYVVISNLDVGNSDMGVLISAVNTNISNVRVHDNAPLPNIGSSAGLIIEMVPQNSSDAISVSIVDSMIDGNESYQSGLILGLGNGGPSASRTLTISRTSVRNNISEDGNAGFVIKSHTNQTIPLDMNVSSTTISGNQVVAVVDLNPSFPFQYAPRTAGIYFAINGLVPKLNFINVTVANNTAVNNVDKGVSLSGFLGANLDDDTFFNLTNTTVANNSVTQAQTFSLIPWVGSFIVESIITSPDFTLNNAAASKNSLIVNNTFNGVSHSCINGLDKSLFGLTGLLDLTPTNLGNNITDDPNCIGYTVVPNILSTLGSLQDNGGPVETIALLNGSPAIGAGGAVLGISTDARGIARPSTPDVGAYQTVQGTSTSSPNNSFAGVAVPNSGLGHSSSDSSLSSTMFMVIISISILTALAINKKYKRKTNA